MMPTVPLILAPRVPPCARSCLRKYDHLFAHSAGDPHHADLVHYCQGWCPHCIGICVRRTCLQDVHSVAAAAAQRAGAEGEAPEEARRLLAMHLVQALSGPAAEIMRLGEEAAAAAGTTVDALPVVDTGATATHLIRVLCNRCATCIEDVHFGCRACGQDFCCACMGEIAKCNAAGGAGQGAAAAATAARARGEDGNLAGAALSFTLC